MMIEPTNVNLPQSTLFPVTVTAILAPAGVSVSKHTPILRYKYWHEVEEGENNDKIRKEFHSTFESPVDGRIEEWFVQVGDEVKEAKFQVVSLIEPCTHSVQYGGLCAICGASLDQQDYTEFSNKDRAPISMAHDTSGLKVSRGEAERIEKSSSDRLLSERKLILVVDLDQTVIHAAVDPTIGEWMRDESNPNHEAVKDVKSFNLEEKIIPHPSVKNAPPATTMCAYYVKVRPGLQAFLESMAEIYEMHVYTMATKSYAKAIASIIDPDGKFFGDRILSRDESGSLVQKSLKRLFPVSTSMVAIIDDRGDVWKWSSNLIRVIPYNFFVGIGDINSSFLPQRTGLIEPTTNNKSNDKQNEQKSVNPKDLENRDDSNNKDKEEDQQQQSQDENAGSPVDQLVKIGEDNPELLQAQADERVELLEQQQAERPLAKLQKDLEESEDEESEDKTNNDTNNNNDQQNHDSHDHHHHQKHILVDNDKELPKLEFALKRVHSEFYKEFDKQAAEPDTNEIIPKIKKQVFKGCVFLFSGVLPLGTNLDSADIVQWVRSFGAVVVADFVDTVTHVIAPKAGTKKVQQAAAYPNINIVLTDWVFACISDWKRVPEDEYRLHVVKDENFDFINDEKTNDNDNDDDDLDTEKFMQSLNQGDVDWDEIDKEVEDFMASSDDDDDGDDDNNDDETGDDESDDDTQSKKRSRDENDTDGTSKRTKVREGEDPMSSEIEGYDEDEFAKELEDDLL